MDAAAVAIVLFFATVVTFGVTFLLILLSFILFVEVAVTASFTVSDLIFSVTFAFV